MATAPQPRPLPSTSGAHRTVITVSVIVAILGLIVFSAIWVRRHSPIQSLDERQLLVELQRSGLRRRRRHQETQRDKGIDIGLLQTIPIVRYDGDSGQLRRAKSLDLERGHLYRDALGWSLEQSQRNIKEMYAEMVATDNPDARKLKDKIPRKPGSEAEEPDCPICAQAFVKNEILRILPCGHRHHQRCVDRWLLGYSGTCPVW
ncbi:hypothetical protein AYO20_07432 [Fonsecaea nubica]|uniref:RING-type domain-containing protein n=1 Tax=Fonsecaea nubica TaxID=856822 RepID=A0A178CTS8_9EURO|nr:hypothetical protein AYO20_07432 [Fonsecaea nubica]OAL33270.1 hypothetical protein AYO20_07432 [Fonsecaea nubica]